MNKDQKCAAKPKQQDIDREDPRYLEGAQAAAARVPLDARQGQAWMWGWIEQTFQDQPPSLKKH